MYQIITNIIGIVIITLVVVVCGNQLFNQKLDFKKIINIFILGIFVLFLVLISYLEKKILRIFLTYTMMAIMYKALYREKMAKVLTNVLITYLLTFSSEFIVGLITLTLSLLFNINIKNLLSNAMLANFLVGFNILILLRIIVKKQNYIFEGSDRILFIFYIITFMLLTFIAKEINDNNWLFNYDLIINSMIIIFIMLMLFVTLSQKYKYNKIKDKYIKVSEYSSINDEVLEEYRLKNHEFKNELVIIRGMAEEKKYKELIDYVDMLSNKNQNVKYKFIGQIKNIKSPGLKGLLNYKIIDFTNQGITIEVVISQEVKKFEFGAFSVKELDNLYSLVGVYLDNAFDAAKESKERKMAINAYMEDDNFILMIANTYDTSKDLSRIDEYKYTTKGKNHGVGLYLASKILREDNSFKAKREIIGEFFIETLKIYKK